MASSSDNISMAVFCDFENVALGVRDANYDKFDIKLVLERLLLKGSIVVKKAYCDWDRYKGFKAGMHEANFELIEIPHVRQSGKNSADIRLVVDALDLCYTKSHVDTFVIVSGDSDFSPLVSKLRENAKRVIGVGVKQSTSDLLVANCDEFIFYDDLVREVRRAAAKRDERKVAPPAKRSPDEGNRRKEELEARKSQAIELVVEMFDALVSERGDSGKIWASLLKDTLKRRRPDFNETYYGFRTFGNLLEEAQSRGMLEFGRDEKSGAYVYRSSNQPGGVSAATEQTQGALLPMEEALADAGGESDSEQPAPAEAQAKPESRRRGRGGRGRKNEHVEQVEQDVQVEPQVEQQLDSVGTDQSYPQADAVQDDEPALVELDETVDVTQPQQAESLSEAADPIADVEPQAIPEVQEKGRRPSTRGGRKPAAAKTTRSKASYRDAIISSSADAEPIVIDAVAVPAAEELVEAQPEVTADVQAAALADTQVSRQIDFDEDEDDEDDVNGNVAEPVKSAKPARKAAPRGRRPAKPKATTRNG